MSDIEGQLDVIAVLDLYCFRCRLSQNTRDTRFLDVV